MTNVKQALIINQYVISKNYNKNTFQFFTIYKIPCNIHEHFCVSRLSRFFFKGAISKYKYISFKNIWDIVIFSTSKQIQNILH